LQLGPRPSCKSRPTNITCEYLWNVVRSTEKDQFGSDQCLQKISFYLTIKNIPKLTFTAVVIENHICDWFLKTCLSHRNNLRIFFLLILRFKNDSNLHISLK
jgi:hypothetical protein